MATRVVATKTGLKLVCDVSAVPVPRPRQVFPLPDLHGAGWPFLTLANGRDPDLGTLRIAVTLGSDLPGRDADIWTLHWSGPGAKGMLPGVVADGLYTIAPVQAAMPYSVWLSRKDAAGTVTVYPTANIDTPSFQAPEGLKGDPGAAGTPGKDAYAHETAKDLVLSSDHGSVDLGKLSLFQKITFSAPGRLRIYISEAARVADLSRTIDVAATAGTGLLLEVAPSVAAGLGGSLSPLFTAAPEQGGDGLCYWTWEGDLGTTCSLTYFDGVVDGTTIIPRDGTNVLQDARAPLPADGVTDDTWIDSSTWDVWKKESGSWVLTGNIKGAAGPQGAKGDTGATGAKGDTGETGAKGDTGAAGLGVPAGGTTGQVLTKASAADNDTEWVTPSSGGGASYGGICHPSDTPPSSPDAWDDEFTSNTLANWTQINAAGLDYCAVENGHLHLQPNAPDAQTSALVKSISGDFTITAKFVLMADMLRNYYFGGLALGNSSSGRLETYSVVSTYTHALGQNTFNSPTSRNSVSEKDTWLGRFLQPYYLRVSKSGSTYSVSASPDGSRWFDWVTNRNLSDWLGSIDQVGIACGRGPSTPSPSVYCEWIRRT